MLSQFKENQIKLAKKWAAKGETGLFFATLLLALILIKKKIWEKIHYTVFRTVALAVAVTFFFTGTSFVPNTIMEAEDGAADYSELEIEEELNSEDYIRTEVNDNDDIASLDDLIVGYEDFPNDIVNSDVVEDDEEDLPESTDAFSKFHKEDWNLLLVNKQHPIPDDYTFALGVIKGSMKCDERILVPLTEMFAGAAKDGVNLIVCSPYRDLSRQEYLFNRKMKTFINQGYSYIDAYKEASAVVTVPGASEHQIGISLDIICDEYSRLDSGFGETSAGKWLKDNSYKYGFVLRYPQDKEDITGIIYEPWHFRYVGIDAATVMYENDLTLEEFVENL